MSYFGHNRLTHGYNLEIMDCIVPTQMKHCDEISYRLCFWMSNRLYV